MSELNSKAIHPTVIEILQFGPKTSLQVLQFPMPATTLYLSDNVVALISYKLSFHVASECALHFVQIEKASQLAKQFSS